MSSTRLSRRGVFARFAFALISFVVLSSAFAGGRDGLPVPTAPTNETTDRYIVRFRDTGVDTQGHLSVLAARMGGRITYVRAMSGDAHVVRLDRALSLDAARALARATMADSSIVYIEPDTKLYPMLVPNDPMYSSQWALWDPAGGINAPAAWDITTGSASIVIGIVDTGYRPHADLVSRIVQGYDFIGDTDVSNDGDGRDADASDPGDYGCNGTGSTWHGTHVAGIAAATTNNGVGISGVNWGSKILPIRVLGKCGGHTSDIVDGMRWASGMSVNGVPANANPARVLNLSLGGSGPCGNSQQSAINDVIARGTVVVVAAGNSNVDVAQSSPANCTGVIAVGATTRPGARASFSNYGSGVALSAPGSGIVSTLNTGSTTPGSDTYAQYSGTSMATPHVAGVVALMLAQNPSMTPAQVKARLQATARAFPTGTGADCTVAMCGAGMLDAGAALAPTVQQPTRVNLAAAANGAVATASSVYNSSPLYQPSGAIDGDHTTWGNGHGWNDNTPNTYPDWIRVDFPSAKPVSEIDVYTVQDNWQNPSSPTESMTFSLYGITAFDVQYWDGSNWVTVPGGSVTGNNKVWTKFAFTPVTTTAIRVQVNATASGYTRIAEIEAYNVSAPVNVARSLSGATASASSIYANNASLYGPAGAIDGDHSSWGNGHGWNDATPNAYPDSIQINFNQTRSINEIDVYTVPDNWQTSTEPTLASTFTLYGITAFVVQYWNGSDWVAVPNGTVTGNNRVWRQFQFSAISTTAIRVQVTGTKDGYARIAEIEAYLAQ